MVGVLAVNVLQRVPRPVHRPQVVVANPLDVLDLVLVEPALPEPTAEQIERLLGGAAIE